MYYVLIFKIWKVQYSTGTVLVQFPTLNWRIRFYTRIDKNEESSNIELWQNDFCDLSWDCLIPIHYIYSRFVSCKFETGKKKIVAYKAVIPINRQFHL